MALWLHDWTLDQLEYDHSLNWCSAESGLTRHQGTCESHQRIYSKLLDAAGIANGRITDELMAIAHSDHMANYQKDGYAHHSTDLSNNYFVRTGKADEWAEKYAEIPIAFSST